jgi:beta-aspartyl-peptidase (threonine type)
MFKRLAILTATFMFVAAAGAQEAKGRIMLVIHGGAGTINRKNMTEEREREYRAALEQALRTGHGVLSKGGTSLDAVEATVRFMEDSPLFNAGKGAVFTHEGRNELDAAIMEGKNKMAGSVAGVTIIKNPISAARAVMEKSKHVMMAGRGAELFATKMGLEIVDPSYFWTERRWKALQDELLKEQKQSGAAASQPAEKKQHAESAPLNERHEVRHGRRGRARPERKSRRGDVDRRHDQQAIRPHRRLADHRSRHLRGQRVVRRLRHRRGRVLHPLERRLRHRRADEVSRPERAAGGG